MENDEFTLTLNGPGLDNFKAQISRKDAAQLMYQYMQAALPPIKQKRQTKPREATSNHEPPPLGTPSRAVAQSGNYVPPPSNGEIKYMQLPSAAAQGVSTGPRGSHRKTCELCNAPKSYGAFRKGEPVCIACERETEPQKTKRAYRLNR